ncbi:alpha-N-arabinofuranosidase [Reichenbachiella ulvae]|uniref:non-reducing end alpha-L-arabinofuranosidase n=1 Tax=Reichenbachiella ulvae TaxID=2980104 RepID=A0ABT3CNE8_9BACT|nr:alpha-L-arabinofuranosidase C-terminal domain-containing protein [Reichenbachiella ulvae]MCV9385081.1 alpha-N-arabinofuranosidase [Reichenbachiella ulvae]
MRRGILSTLALVLLVVQAWAQDATVTVKTTEGEHVINRNIYGHFAEHLGRCIYDGIYVGDDSTIPNTDGVRNDIIDALVELKVPVLRWPGGCFADTYHWMDGIGDPAKRPSIVNQWWGGSVEDNSFGTHDFLNLCERIGAEPYLAGNVGSGQVKELADWVQYVNHPGGSPMSGLRIENGQKEPWNVKYWGVGNEMWGCGGNMAPEFYANLYRQYSTFMTDWTNSDGLYRIASGANGADYQWTEVLMRDIPKPLIEGVALHSYSVIDWGKKGPAKNFGEELYFKTMKAALFMEELVTKHIAIMDKYDPEGRVDLIVDEWGGWYDSKESETMGVLYQQNTMRDAMIAGATLNIFNNHADRIKMANLAQIVNVLQAVILTNEEKLILTPTYHVMKMYNVHQDAVLLPLELETSDYEFQGEKLPAVSASASKDESGAIHISLVNIDAKESQTVILNLDGTDNKKMTGEILASDKLEDYNDFDEADKISPKKFSGFKGKNGEYKVTLPPFSVVVLELK